MERSREAGAGGAGGGGNVDDGGGVVLARYGLDVSLDVSGGSGNDDGAVHQLARYSLDVSGGGGNDDGAVHQLARYSLDVSGGGGNDDGAVHQLARYSPDVSGGGSGKDDGAVQQLARYSLDVSAGCGGRRSTLLDEYERLAFEAQLKSAILRRCFSEPSPARFVQPADAPPLAHGTEGERRRDEPAAGAGRSWRLHEVVARWLEALKPVFAWLRSAWERRRKEQATPRVQLLDYLC